MLLIFNGTLNRIWPPLFQRRVPTRGKQLEEPRVPFRFERGIEVHHSDGGEAWFVVVYGEEETLRIDVRPGMHGCMHIDRRMTCVTAFLRARHLCSLFYCFSQASWIKSKKVWRMISWTSGARHVTLRMHITLTLHPFFQHRKRFQILFVSGIGMILRLIL